MHKKILIYLASLFLLSSCTDGFRSYFKRSANNKLFDMDGFKGERRAPLYNQKYISKAKRNIASNEDYDEEYDEDSEYKVPSRVYRQMYLDSLAQEKLKEKGGYNRRRLSNYDDDYYPSLQEANKRVRKATAPNNKDIEQELKEIKSMLRKTQEELSKYKCSAKLDQILDKKEYLTKQASYNKKTLRTNLQRRFIDSARQQQEI